jgi:hypothetical protein
LSPSPRGTVKAQPPGNASTRKNSPHAESCLTSAQFPQSKGAKTTKYNPEQHEKFLREGETCEIVTIENKTYAQYSEIQLRAGNQFLTVLDISDENVVIKNGRAIVYCPDEGAYMGVLVEERNGPRWTQIMPADISIEVRGNWNPETTSGWIESQFG